MAIKRIEKTEEKLVDRPISVKLQQPIEAFGETVSVLEMREPKYKDVVAMMKASSEESEQFLHLIAKLSDIPPSSIGELSLKDVKEVQKVLTPFLT